MWVCVKSEGSGGGWKWVGSESWNVMFYREKHILTIKQKQKNIKMMSEDGWGLLIGRNWQSKILFKNERKGLLMSVVRCIYAWSMGIKIPVQGNEWHGGWVTRCGREKEWYKFKNKNISNPTEYVRCCEWIFEKQKKALSHFISSCNSSCVPYRYSELGMSQCLFHIIFKAMYCTLSCFAFGKKAITCYDILPTTTNRENGSHN